MAWFSELGSEIYETPVERSKRLQEMYKEVPGISGYSLNNLELLDKLKTEYCSLSDIDRLTLGQLEHLRDLESKTDQATIIARWNYRETLISDLEKCTGKPCGFEHMERMRCIEKSGGNYGEVCAKFESLHATGIKIEQDIKQLQRQIESVSIAAQEQAKIQQQQAKRIEECSAATKPAPPETEANAPQRSRQKEKHQNNQHKIRRNK